MLYAVDVSMKDRVKMILIGLIVTAVCFYENSILLYLIGLVVSFLICKKILTVLAIKDNGDGFTVKVLSAAGNHELNGGVYNVMSPKTICESATLGSCDFYMDKKTREISLRKLDRSNVCTFKPTCWNYDRPVKTLNKYNGLW